MPAATDAHWEGRTWTDSGCLPVLISSPQSTMPKDSSTTWAASAGVPWWVTSFYFHALGWFLPPSRGQNTSCPGRKTRHKPKTCVWQAVMGAYSFLKADIAKYHRLYRLKKNQTKTAAYVSHFWRLEVWKLRRQQLPVSPKTLGKKPSLPRPGFWWLPAVLSILGLWEHSSILCLCLQRAIFALCVWVKISLFWSA